MNILQNKQIEKEEVLPTKLAVLEVLTKRSFYPNQKDISELNRLRTGLEGEKVAADYIDKYGKAHWTLRQNVWFDYFSILEYDGVLLTKKALYILEIKNYLGLYMYENGLSKLNHRELSANPIDQTRTRR